MSNQDFAIQVIRKLPGEASVMDMAQELELSAGIVPRPRVVTVGSFPDEAGPTVAERNGGVQSAHSFVPAGAVYHLEAPAQPVKPVSSPRPSIGTATSKRRASPKPSKPAVAPAAPAAANQASTSASAAPGSFFAKPHGPFSRVTKPPRHAAP
ncbi:hypothetical protein LBMAG56_32970 [Verrucomicrobiota bacterium]|nr:hypothetical protein LBMAG56_32970 [Verrucomicrobiota bacterium]